MDLAYEQLINPYPILVGSSNVRVRKPCIGEIYDRLINRNENNYNGYLGLLLSDVNTLINKLDGNFADLYNKASPEAQAKITPYVVLTSISQYRELLTEALSFFIDGYCRFNAETKAFDVYDSEPQDEAAEPYGFINELTYGDVVSAILQTNMINKKVSSAPPKFKNTIARKIHEKMDRKRKEIQPMGDKYMTMGNIISSLSASHQSYNYTNIYKLTVYQLYDAFFQHNFKEQRDVIRQRWAAWGTDTYDFSAWYTTRAKINN